MLREMTPREEGELAGLRIEATAGDCPYLPGRDNKAREAWLAGFSASRPEASVSSDPTQADDPEPDHGDQGDVPAFKEG